MNVINWMKEHKFLLLIVLVGALLRFYKLDYQSLWIDEIFSMIQSSPEKSFGEIYKFLKEFDPHPPLYYFSLHSFLSIFGDSMWMARFFSALCGVGGIFAIYYLSKEILNKNIGLIASFLTAINFFHIYYSQEVRMYSLMFLTTTISFLFLIRFIKQPNTKSMIWHTIFATLMIYTQFFSLFTLFAQYIILLFFVIRPYNSTNKKFFILSFSSSIITFIFYIPAIKIFLKTSEMKSIWIQMPSLDVYTSIFKEFFGFSEILVYLVCTSIILFLFKLMERKSLKQGFINPEKETQVFTFFICFIWIFITLIIPLIASYVNLPMIVSRYFINILPAILILVSAGLYYSKNHVISGLIIFFFFLFSVTDILIVKDYYSKITKSQFRELTTNLKQRTRGSIKVVTYWSWLIPYYFEDTPNISIHPNTLDEYLNDLRNGKNDKIPFWYLDGHSRPFQITSENQTYLNDNFRILEDLEYYDCWAKHFIPKNYNENFQDVKKDITLKDFKTRNINNEGELYIFENEIIESAPVELDKGNYQLIIQGQSLPVKPINNENAHIIIKLNDNEISNFYLSEKENFKKIIDFEVVNKQTLNFKIQFDNDIFKDGDDRNVKLRSFKIVKKN